MHLPARPLLIYQDTCPFCRAAARFVAFLDRDHNVAVLGYEDRAAAPYTPAIPDEDFERSYQLLLPDGRRLQTGEATVTLMEMVKPTRWIGWLARRLRLTGVIGVL